MPFSKPTLWIDIDAQRYFLVPADRHLSEGQMRLVGLEGHAKKIAAEDVIEFEVTEDQARQWAQEELGKVLGEMRGAIDEKLADWRREVDEYNRTPVSEDTTVMPNAVSDLFKFLKEFPGVLAKSLSGKESRVGEARDVMAELQRRLKESGIDLDDRFTNFPDRLAELRRDVEQERAAKKSTKNEPPPDKR